MNVISFDTETDLMGPGNMPGKFVCVQWAHYDSAGNLQEYIQGRADDGVDELVESLLQGTHILTAHNAAYDMAVLLREFPQFASLIFQAYRDERVRCTEARERLTHLSSSGHMDRLYMPDGSSREIRYSMGHLMQEHYGLDLSAEKEDPEGWRFRYGELRDIPTDQWPEDALTYALGDARHQMMLYESQEKRAPNATGPRSMATQEFQSFSSFCLFLATCWGVACDLEAREKLAMQLEDELSSDKLAGLIKRGVLRPGQAAAPYANQRARVFDLVGSADPMEHRIFLEKNGIRFKAPKKASINTKKLHNLVTDVCKQHGFEVQETPKGAISTAADFLNELHGFDATLDEYIARQKLQKLVTTELPAMTGPVVHPNYKVLVETGRTSSYGGRRHSKSTFVGPVIPSTNIQQKDPRARHCFVARPGHALVSIDYSALERLCTLAQTQIDYFKQSKLADVINAGRDPHAYLGAVLAKKLDKTFRESLPEGLGLDELHDLFIEMGRSSEESVRDFYKHWRTFAKPTGLGFPGGLGPKTFITFAKGTYGVDLVKTAGSVDKALALAKNLREIWFETFPEGRKLFDLITRTMRDPINGSRTVQDDDGEKREVKLYSYTSPMGMYRAGCTFTSVANGVGLQTPAAEGAKLAGIWLTQACYDPALEHILFGSHVPIFVHDEYILEVQDDEQLHDKAFAAADIMVEAMETVVKDVKVRAEPAAMYRWNKGAECVLGDDGRLKVWTPKKTA